MRDCHVRTVPRATVSFGEEEREAHWLGEWKDRAAPISKAFSVLFPYLIVGLLNATAVQDSGAAFILVSYFASKSLKLTPRAKLTPS
jgi:hypothetical protein